MLCFGSILAWSSWTCSNPSSPAWFGTPHSALLWHCSALPSRPLKRRSVDFWRCTRVFYYLVHLPIGTIFRNIDQYLGQYLNELIEICIFSKEIVGPCPHLWSNNTRGKKNVKIIINEVIRDAKWSEDSKSGLKIQIEQHLTPFMAQTLSKISWLG